MRASIWGFPTVIVGGRISVISEKVMLVWLHQSRGRRSNRQVDPCVRQAILQRYDEVYDGFGPTLAGEKLAGEGYVVDHETLRRWLLAEGKWQRQRRRSRYLQRRERREQFGALVQMDWSPLATTTGVVWTISRAA